ncbi:MAG: 4Fe-4S binding protein [Deltaproteobacteria bacterium]|nr:4Fe-4S binding protein [Deltaproteobacteria bacterium]
MRLGKTKKSKTVDGNLLLHRRMIGLEQELYLDRRKCCGCGDCENLCPAEAVSSTEPVVDNGTVRKRVIVDVDPEECTFCGACAVVCPAKAIAWRENERTVPNVITKAILPALDEAIEVRAEDCRIECGLACESSCPVDAIEVETETGEDKERIAEVRIDREQCLYCGKCEPACPFDLIAVRSARSGVVSFRPEHCLPSCRACTEVCPTGALYVQDDRVRLEEAHCIYCRACAVVCPATEALEVRRERIRGLPLSSELWADYQGKLVSAAARIRLIRENAARKRERAFRTRID